LQIGDPSDTRGIIFMSHHQYFSAFSDQKQPSLATPQQLASLVPAGRTVLWLWGHEHRLAFYDLLAVKGCSLNVYARCIGVGGFPTQLAQVPPSAKKFRLRVFDDRVYSVQQGAFWKAKIGFQGFSHLNFSGPFLSINYRSLHIDGNGVLSPSDSDLLVSETWLVDSTGNVELSFFDVVNSNMTVVNDFDDS